MARIYASVQNGMRVEIQIADQQMRWLDRKSRNVIIRDSFQGAGQEWIPQYLPDRFTSYVRQAPFNYPKKHASWYAQKLRKASTGELHAIWARIKARDFMGWDPFAAGAYNHIPRQLVAKWVADHPGMYKTRRLSRFIQTGEGKKVHADLMRWAKKRVKEIANNLNTDGVMLPLVMDGVTRKAALSGAYAKAIATAKKAQLTITIPRGHAMPQRYADIISRLPEWEFNFIRQRFAARLASAMSPLANARLEKIRAGIAAKKAASDAKMEARVAARMQRRTRK